ncbi:MAG: Beta-galactosidase GanA [Candidatus Hydrogenedentes bacterium ADurb.Bin179]|nr:MAG: Beta-galactosidase GanA [Candidatus Hydrogenedentes bacterium ADurb.Bin179]
MNFISHESYRLVWRCLLTAVLLGSGYARGASPFTKEFTEESPKQAVAWAKPLAGGSLKVLFIAPRFTLGDVAELVARVDLEYETAGLWTATSLGYDPVALNPLPEHGSPEEMLARLDALLDVRWHVIVLANFNTRILPDSVLSRILDQVAGGTGLLTVHLHDATDSRLMTVLQVLPQEEGAPSIAAGIGECAFPGNAVLDTVGSVQLHEKGRVITLDYPGDPPENHCLIQVPSDPVDLDTAYEDNAYALVIRALCIAARRINGVRILNVQDVAPSGPNDLEIPPDFYPEFVQSMRDSVVAQPSRPFRILLNEPADQRYTVQVQLRRKDSDTQISYRDKTPLQRGDVAHVVEIPAGPGEYLLDAWLCTRSGVADWFTANVVIPGWPEFYDLYLEKKWLLPNDSLEISLKVRPIVSPDRRAAVYARAQDGFGRIVSSAVQGVDNSGGTVTLRLHFSDLLSSLIKVEVFALDSEPRPFSEWELHRAYRELRYLSVRRPDRLANLELIAATEELREYAAGHSLKALSEAGVTAVHAPGGEAAIVAAARNRLGLVPELTRVAAEQARDGVYREPCLNSPDYRARLDIELREKAAKHWAGSSTRYSLGNRNYLGGTEENICQCGYCMSVFQETLREGYGSVAALNEAWGTQFGDWDFVEVPRDIGPGYGGSPSPWMDFREFMTRQFTEFHHWAHDRVAATDAEGMVGARFAGDTSIYYGYDWPGLFQYLDFVSADYSPLFFEKVHSYAARGSLSGITLRDTRCFEDGAWLSWLPWRLALNQVGALWLDTLWGDAHHAAPYAWMQPDGSLTPEFNRLAGTVCRIRDSVGPLLYAADTPAPNIAVYDSPYSRYLSGVNDEYADTCCQSQEAAAQLLRFAGVSFQFVSKTQLVALDPAVFPVLVLPFCRALDKDERDALRAYFKNGGALIADVIPGTFDSHGRRVSEQSLNDIFGVNPADTARVVQAVLAPVDAGSAAAKDAGWASVDASVVAGAGIALARAGETAAWIVNRAGNGHTFLLNHPFRAVQRQGNRRILPAEGEAVAVFLRDLPGMADRLSTASEPFLGTICQYQFGDARIYAVLADVDAPKQKVRLPLQRESSVYNALTGELISRPHRHTFVMEPGTVEVVSCLSYEVEELVLEVPKVAFAGQRLPLRIMVQPEKDKAGKHLFLVDLLPANRPALPWYRRSIPAAAGIAEMYLPLAMNELPGWYTVRVHDSLTGLETTAALKIASPTE